MEVEMLLESLGLSMENAEDMLDDSYDSLLTDLESQEGSISVLKMDDLI